MHTRRHGWRRRLSVLFAAIVTLAGLAVALPTPAQASPVRWTSDISNIRGGEIITAPNGAVTAAGCGTSGATVGTKTWSAAGGLTGSTPIGPTVQGIAWPYLSLCNEQQATGKDGALYGVDYTSYPQEKLVGYQPSGTTRKWAKILTLVGCTGGIWAPEYIRVGSDGNVYTAARPQGGSGCVQNQDNLLYSFTPAGAQRWVVNLGRNPTWMMTAYVGGVVVVGWDKLIRHYTNAGAISGMVSIDETSSNIAIAPKAVTSDGVVMVTVYRYTTAQEGCSISMFTSSVAMYGPTGVIWRYLPPACSYDVGHLANPDGSMTFIRPDSLTGVSQLVTAYRQNFDKVLTLPTEEAGRTFAGGAEFTPDTNGNMMVWRRYTREGGRYTGYEFKLLNPHTGGVHGVFYTDSLSAQESIRVVDVAMAPGMLYMTAYHCPAWSTCSENLHLHAVNVAELGMDFPRGKVLGVAKVTFAQMAVSGDSYTSGIGALKAGESYAPGSCYRSPSAYGPLVDADPKVKLQLQPTAFVACAGAETQHVTTIGYKSEPVQLSRIPTTAKVILMTIGGNDAKFPRFGGLCLFHDCALPQYTTEFNGYLAALRPNLEKTYKAILAKATGGTLYVLHYPNLLPQQNCVDAGSPGWWAGLVFKQANDEPGYAALAGAYLTPAEVEVARELPPAIENNEITAANAFQAKLNLTITDAVTAVQAVYPGRIKLVQTTGPDSPLTGHRLCSDDEWFHGVVGEEGRQGDTFHPNVKGQEGMKLLAIAAIKAHQPQYVLN